MIGRCSASELKPSFSTQLSLSLMSLTPLKSCARTSAFRRMMFGSSSVVLHFIFYLFIFETGLAPKMELPNYSSKSDVIVDGQQAQLRSFAWSASTYVFFETVFCLGCFEVHTWPRLALNSFSFSPKCGKCRCAAVPDIQT